MSGFINLFVWALALPLLSSSSWWWCPIQPVYGFGSVYVWPKHVFVKNELSPQTPMTLHCKSKDDDLAVHVLDYNQKFDWKFHVNFLQTTRFWCYMLWYDEHLRRVEGTFDIYYVKRDWPRCDTDCYWSVRKDGLYSSGSGYWEFMYPWAYS